MELIKIDNSKIEFLKDIIDISIPGETFELTENNETVGYGRITKNNIDPIFIYIKEDKRSNGYGTILFEKMLEKIEYPEITINISEKMIPMKNIISKNNSIEIGKNQKIITYIIKK